MDVINNLLNYKNLKIIQNPEYFSFSLDSVLLSNFVTLNSNIKNIIDLGTGNAPIPLILSTKTKAKIYGVEIQNEIYKLAEKTVAINRLKNRIVLLNDDIKKINASFKTDYFDVVICNPPYFKVSKKSNLNISDYKTLARHEVSIKLEDILNVTKKILKNNGVFAIVYRPERLLELLLLMRKYNLEPKRVRFVYPKIGVESNLILVEGKKNGKSGLKILSPLYTHNEDGSYTDEVRSMFSRRDENETKELQK